MVSERFYLYATSGIFDNTKDIGFTLGRDVSVFKIDAVSGAPVADAQFRLYGPFESVEAAQAATLDPTMPLKTVSTNEDGEASFGTLNWYQVYVIEEAAAAPHYLLDGADADSMECGLIPYEGTGTDNPAWVLAVPDADATSLIQVVQVENQPETTDVSGRKTWEDANDQDGKRPESITIRLMANDVEKAQKTVTEEDGWAWTFSSLPKYENGAEIVYTITEDEVEGYTAEVSGMDVTNRYVPSTISVSVQKAWEDANDQDGIRPAEITVRLLADQADTGKTLVLNESNHWSGIFDGLKEYSQGEKITYSVQEDTVSGYRTQIAGNAGTGFHITNAHTPETVTIAGQKTWDDLDDSYGKRPDSITLFLMADGTKVAEQTVTAQSGAGWEWSFENMPKYKAGREIIYTIAEAKVAGYTAEVTGYDVKNTLMSAEVEICGEKRVDVPAAPWAEFSFSLTAQNADAPMPDGKAGGTASVSHTGPGAFSFGRIRFIEPGTYRYQVTETAGSALGYVYDKSVYVVEVKVTEGQDSLTAEVTCLKDGAAANEIVFENHYRTAGLTVVKSVTGRGGSTTEAFAFTITLTDAGGTRLAASYPYTGTGGAPSGTMDNGIMTVSLAHNQSIRIDGIPVGARYTVTEAANNAYVVSATSPDGVIPESGAVASFVNRRRTYSDVPKTGYGETTTRYVVAGLCLLTGLLAMVLRRRLRRK